MGLKSVFFYLLINCLYFMPFLHSVILMFCVKSNHKNVRTINKFIILEIRCYELFQVLFILSLNKYVPTQTPPHPQKIYPMYKSMPKRTQVSMIYLEVHQSLISTVFLRYVCVGGGILTLSPGTPA